MKKHLWEKEFRNKVDAEAFSKKWKKKGHFKVRTTSRWSKEKKEYYLVRRTFVVRGYPNFKK